MMAAAPVTSEGYGIGGGPAATQPPASDNAQVTPAPETSVMTAPETTPSGELRQEAPAAAPAVKATPKPVNIWLYIWLGLAAVLITTALLIRQASLQSFRRKVNSSHNK
jgi:hypothetical protein